jgi:hypothetical protein
MPTKTRSTHISSSKLPGTNAWVIKANGSKIGVVAFKTAEGLFSAVAGHDKLGFFDSKVQATDAIAKHVGVIS